METCIETPNVSNKLNVPENLIKILGTLFFFFFHITSTALIRNIFSE